MKQSNFKKIILFSSIFIFLIIFQQSCIKEYDNFDKLSKNADYSPAIAGAIAHSKLTVRDIIKDYDDNELFEIADNGFLYLMYQKRVFTETAGNLIHLDNQEFSLDNPTPYTKDTYDNITASGGYRTFPQLDTLYDFMVSHQENLDSIVFDALDLKIEVNSSFHLDGVLDITFPALQKNGQAFSTKIYPDNSGVFTYQVSNHLEDYTLVCTNNLVLVRVNLKLKDGTANNGEELTIKINMDNLDFDKIYGYVGNISTSIPQDTVHISIFDNAFDGAVYFEDPSMTLHLENTIGVPVRSYFGDLYTYSTIDNPGDTINGTWQKHNFPIDFLDIAHPKVIDETAYQTEVYDVNNFPAIRDVISSQPRYLFFEVDSVEMNPNGYDQSYPNFIFDDSQLSVDLEVKLPLWGNALYSLVDTIQLNIEENFQDIAEHFVEANLRTIFDNFLPTNAYAQVIFTDSLYYPLDTLYKSTDIGERLIQSAILDEDGRAQQAVKKTTDILFGNGSSYEHDINDLQHVRHAIIIATLKTDEIGSTSDVNGTSRLVKFYGDNYLEVKFGVKGQGKYQGSVE